MKLKRFVATDIRNAMQQIKADLGPDAVIVSSHSVNQGIEVLAAVDYDPTILTAQAAESIAEPVSQAITPTVFNTPLEDMHQEIQTLRGMMEVWLKGTSGSGEPLHNVLIQKLLQTGVNPNVATSLVRKIKPSFSQKKAWQILLDDMQDKLPIHTSQKMEEGGVYAFTGSTGVGKTTTLAKIATRFVLKHGADSLGLVTMDTMRIAAQEQLVSYGKILGVPVCAANDAVDLSRVLNHLKDKKLVLIDTAGMNPADTRLDNQMEILSQHMHSIVSILVLSATSHYRVHEEVIKRYQQYKVNQCIITRLDESSALGGVLSAIMTADLPVSYVTHGQRVPEDIKMATRHQLMELFTNEPAPKVRQTTLNLKKYTQIEGEVYV